jgi:trans-aconitate methyltransferase
MARDRGHSYVHGYDEREAARLSAQAGSVLDLLHVETSFPPDSVILEVGCGTGARTITLAKNNPNARIVAFDHSMASLACARESLATAGCDNVEFLHADLFGLPSQAKSFDHIFVCFVLEHLSSPLNALTLLARLFKPPGTITVFEGDHGSTLFHLHSDAAMKAIACQVELQRRLGGNAWIGRELYPLPTKAGFQAVDVPPRVYVDGNRPDLMERFTKRTFTAMIEGVREQALEAGLIDPAAFDEGIRGLFRTSEEDGVFCYTFFKGFGTIVLSLDAAPAAMHDEVGR